MKLYHFILWLIYSGRLTYSRRIHEVIIIIIIIIMLLLLLLQLLQSEKCQNLHSLSQHTQIGSFPELLVQYCTRMITLTAVTVRGRLHASLCVNKNLTEILVYLLVTRQPLI